MYELRKSDKDVMIAEGAAVLGEVKIGKNVSIWHNAVVRGDMGEIVIGDETNIQDGAILHEGTVLGKGCTVGHGAIVHGCTVGDHVLIGMGSIILDHAKIGNHCLVGAGALVTGKMDAPDGSLILGSPAKVVGQLSPELMKKPLNSKDEYLQFMAQYQKEKSE